jgi:hypothetical protein
MRMWMKKDGIRHPENFIRHPKKIIHIRGYG